MNKITGRPHLLLHSVLYTKALCLGLCGMVPALALAANPYPGVESSAKPIAGEAEVDAQTLAQKPDIYLQLIADRKSVV